MNYINRALSKATRISKRSFKHIRQIYSHSGSSEKNIVFVTGCQRSGTSMMYKTFESDIAAAVYDEVSVLSNNDPIEGLRLNDLDTVKQIIYKNPASIIVAKPLVESQRLTELLEFFPNSTAIWMYRHYTDVASSNLKRFGTDNGFNDIEPIYERDSSNWRYEHLSDDVTKLITSFERDKLLPGDAAALFWYARNSLFFQQTLENNKRVYLCNYENLVKNPQSFIENIYNFIGADYPNDKVLNGISPRSIGKGSELQISSNVREVCDEMLERLNEQVGVQ